MCAHPADHRVQHRGLTGNCCCFTLTQHNGTLFNLKQLVACFTPCIFWVSRSGLLSQAFIYKSSQCFILILQIFMLFLSHAYGGLQRYKPASSIPEPSLPFNNAQRYGQLIADGPLHLLWPCLIPWLLLEADLGYAWLHSLPGMSQRQLSAAHSRVMDTAFVSACK